MCKARSGAVSHKWYASGGTSQRCDVTVVGHPRGEISQWWDSEPLQRSSWRRLPAGFLCKPICVSLHCHVSQALNMWEFVGHECGCPGLVVNCSLNNRSTWQLVRHDETYLS